MFSEDDETIDYTWKSIMSSSAGENGSYIQKLYWSNPGMNVYDYAPDHVTPMGSAISDNAQTLNLSAPIVSRFRCGSPHVDNVWMKDTYNDTGQEPDPNTVGQRMCHSPYIWIRNERDDNSNPLRPFPNQHRHENPIFNQSNWIYVKIHNGGIAMTGHLEIYYAHASPSLQWPGSWTRFKNISITMEATSTRIVETEWKKEDIPGTGHYCLLARWVADPDPLGPDIASVADYTRQNNNVVWRNLNIVALMEVNQMTATMMIRNTTTGPLSLQFDEPVVFPDTTFLSTGKVYIIPDKILMNAWKMGKLKSNGFKYENGKFRMIKNHAVMENIRLPQKTTGWLTVVFVKSNKTIPDQYLFTVSQFAGKTSGENYIGEVGYEIYTYNREDVKPAGKNVKPNPK
jgi:hypothetical protein